MENISNASLLSTAITVIILIIVLMILYHVLKGVLKIAAMLVAIVLLYLGYCAFTGQNMPKNGAELIRQLRVGSSHVCESAKPFVKQIEGE